MLGEHSQSDRMSLKSAKSLLSIHDCITDVSCEVNGKQTLFSTASESHSEISKSKQIIKFFSEIHIMSSFIGS